MRRTFLLLLITATAACSRRADDPTADPLPAADNAVRFCCDTPDNGAPRAATSYLSQGSRFVCRMYYQGTQGSTALDHSAEAALKVDNNRGNSVYRRSDFDESDMLLDDYGFDRKGQIFYWQNRQEHAFVALTDLHANHRDSTHYVPAFRDYRGTTEAVWNVYDLRTTRRYTMPGSEAPEAESPAPAPEADTFLKQPDPARALTLMAPQGATQETNRVHLTFQHCFAQVQVNVKPSADGSMDASGDLTDPAGLLAVDLLGVSEEAYVPHTLADDGTLPPPDYKPVNVADYTEAELAANRWGTAVQAFEMETAAAGYLKSFHAIAYGRLQAIRIYWREAANPAIVHASTHTVEEALADLQSGMKYVFNFELRRGTLAVIQARLEEWAIDSDSYRTDGSIVTTTLTTTP